jgi:hypothetical protein
VIYIEFICIEEVNELTRPKAAISSTKSNLEQAILDLMRGDGQELNAYLKEVKKDVSIAGTQANIHFYMISHDGNELPRLKDLARATATRAMDYAIPRSEIKKAHDYYVKHNSMSKIAELMVKAKSLFTNLSQSGEGGELLLYLLIQNYLAIPQLLCKMPLKTSREMHYHGVDGIHAKYDSISGKIGLYWGESKLHQNISSAISDCMDSIKPFLFDSGGTDASQERDLQLIRDNLDLIDSDLELALLEYLDPDNPNFKKLQYRAVCLIGFDSKKYPSIPNSKTEDEVSQEIEKAINRWQKNLDKHIKSRHPLENYIIEIFMIPFPSVQKFRDAFIKEISNG